MRILIRKQGLCSCGDASYRLSQHLEIINAPLQYENAPIASLGEVAKLEDQIREVANECRIDMNPVAFHMRALENTIKIYPNAAERAEAQKTVLEALIQSVTKQFRDCVND